MTNWRSWLINLLSHKQQQNIHADQFAADPYYPPSIHSNSTTAEDIFYCFRLLLGRCPNAEEWPGHSSRVGQVLENVVGSFVTSREFAERNLLSSSDRGEIELVQLSAFSLFLRPDDLAVGRHIVDAGCYEPAIGAVLQRQLKPGMTVIDIGANIGYLTMLAASLVTSSGQVIAVEPNPENIKLLEASRRLNRFDQVRVIAAAAGRDTDLLVLNTSYSNGIAGKPPDKPEAILMSRPVPCVALDAVLPRDRRVNLVKIDVEGGELNALIGMERTIDRDRPAILSEFSPGALVGISNCTGPEYLGYLTAKGYGISVINQDGSESHYAADIAAVMDAYVRSGIDHIDILARPR